MEDYNNENVNCIINTLKIISDIKKDQKIMIRDDKLIVDDRYFQFLRRWYDNDNRYLSIIFIETIIVKSIELESELVDYIKKTKTNDEYDRDERNKNINTNSDILNKLSEALNNSINGLENIKETYVKDELINEKINTILEQINGDE